MDSGTVISDSEVDRMVSVPKFIEKTIEPSQLQMSEDGRFRLKKYKLECEEYGFFVMIRQNTDRPDNFSIILVYEGQGKREIPVLRFNGNHGRHKNRLEGEIVNGPHIHKLTERYQRTTTHPDGYAVATREYTDLRSALDAFMKAANIRVKSNRHNRTLEEFE